MSTAPMPLTHHQTLILAYISAHPACKADDVWNGVNLRTTPESNRHVIATLVRSGHLTRAKVPGKCFYRYSVQGARPVPAVQ